jgi:hypothetical protein
LAEYQRRTLGASFFALRFHGREYTRFPAISRENAARPAVRGEGILPLRPAGVSPACFFVFLLPVLKEEAIEEEAEEIEGKMPSPRNSPSRLQVTNPPFGGILVSLDVSAPASARTRRKGISNSREARFK